MATNTLTVGDYTARFRAWMSSDPLHQLLASTCSCRPLAMNTSSLERLEENSIWEPGSLNFSTEASFGSLGVHFSAGKSFRRNYYDDESSLCFSVVSFIAPGAQGPQEKVVSPSAMSVCLDECLGATSFAFAGGFTASITVRHSADLAAGQQLLPPTGTTLLCLGKMLRVEKTARGASKFFMTGQIISVPEAPDSRWLGTIAEHARAGTMSAASGTVIYSEATALFIRPTGDKVLPVDRYLLYDRTGPYFDGDDNTNNDKQLARMAQLVAQARADDPQALANAEAARADAVQQAVADPTASSGGQRVLLTHLSGLRREQWAASDPFVRSMLVGLGDARACFTGDPGARSLHGKVFMLWKHERLMKAATGAIHFTVVAEGPPGSAHGGSVFAAFEFGILHACVFPALGLVLPLEQQDSKVDDVEGMLANNIGLPRIVSCTVEYRTRVPLQTTLKASVAITNASKSGDDIKLTLSGSLSSPDGSVTYDLVKADVHASEEACQAWSSSFSFTNLPRGML